MSEATNKVSPATQGRLSENVALDDDLDVATVYGVRISGELLRCLGEPTKPGIWMRIVKVEGGVSTIEQRTDLTAVSETGAAWMVSAFQRGANEIRSMLSTFYPDDYRQGDPLWLVELENAISALTNAAPGELAARVPTPDANTHGETGSGAEPRSKPSDGEVATSTNNDERAESSRKPASPALQTVTETRPGKKLVCDKPVAWIREWDGDDSDIGNFLIEPGATPPADNHQWEPLYAESEDLNEFVR